MPQFFLRIGSLAEVHIGESDSTLRRGQRVVVRTDRGVELGETIGPCGTRAMHPSVASNATARVLRPTSEQDELLLRRLAKYKRRAIEECRRALMASGSTATLLDIEHLFDGSSLVMHFLGDVSSEDKSLVRHVANRYESIVQAGRFAALLQQGCGPGCGTEAAGDCGSQCSSCIAGCQTKPNTRSESR